MNTGKPVRSGLFIPEAEEARKAAYLRAVCSQLHGGGLRARVRRELSAHIDDMFEAALEHFPDPGEAMNWALEDTGAPEELGVQLDRVHNPGPRWYIPAGAVLLLLLLYNGSAAGYLDGVSVLLILTLGTAAAALMKLCGRGACCGRILCARGYLGTGLALALAGAVLWFFSEARPVAMRVNLLPALYGMLLYSVLRLAKPRRPRRAGEEEGEK